MKILYHKKLKYSLNLKKSKYKEWLMIKIPYMA